MSATRSPTVCQLLHSLKVGGAEVLAARLARRLAHAYRFVFICLDELGPLGEELRREGFAVEVAERRPGTDWRLPLRLARLMRQQHVELIHAHQYTPFIYGIGSRLLYRKPPVLFTEHGRFFPDNPRRKRLIANWLLLERRDRVVGVGEAVRQALIRNEGIPERRVGLIYNGVPLDRFVGHEGEREAVRRELSLSPGDFVVVMIARLDPVKDHCTAVRAIGELATRGPNVRLVLVGDGPERVRVEALVRELGLNGRVLLLGIRSDVPRLLGAADAAMLSSVSEGIPLTLIEAMASGLPVVSTRVGGVPEVVLEEQTGLLAPPGDSATLAAQLLRLAADAPLRRRMGEAGRQRAQAVFSEDRMLAEYDRLYREMLHVR